MAHIQHVDMFNVERTFAGVFRQYEHLQSTEFHFAVEKSLDDEVGDALTARSFTGQVVADWNLDVVQVEHRERPRRNQVNNALLVPQPTSHAPFKTVRHQVNNDLLVPQPTSHAPFKTVRHQVNNALLVPQPASF